MTSVADTIITPIPTLLSVLMSPKKSVQMCRKIVIRVRKESLE